MNYRLSIFGFLDVNQGSSISTINYGIQDQLQVLLWIKDNIAAFGEGISFLNI